MTTLENIRSGVALRPTAHLSSDRSTPKLGVDDGHVEREQDAHENYYLDLGMEQWLPLVEELSFETMSVPLSVTDAGLLRSCYHHLHGRTYYDDLSQPTSASLPPDLVADLKKLGDRLWPSMKALGAQEAGVFGKLSGRSAKDAPLYTCRLDEGLQTQLSAHGADAADDNVHLLCLFEAALELMRAHDPASLLWMLVNSQRVDEDLDVALRHPGRWDQAIVLRRWWSGVSTDLEFRMFVVDGIPTGLTQYNSMVHSPRIASRGAAIADCLYMYYEAEVLPRLKSSPFYEAVRGRFACDLALHPDALRMLDSPTGESTRGSPLTKKHIKLVELNCFYEATGMGLVRDESRMRRALEISSYIL